MRSIVYAAAAAVCLCLSITNTASAAPPRATVTGPTGGLPGDILVLDGSESIADFFAWTVLPELPNKRPTILVLEGGRKCLVCSVPGVYTVIFTVANDEGIDQLKWVVTVGPQPGPTPPPGPNPEPGPSPEPDPAPVPPEPSLPDGVYKLPVFARDQALALVVSPNRAMQAAAVAGGLEGVAAAISAGTLTLPNHILAAVLAANRDALGEAGLRDWLRWGTAVAQRLQVLYDSGRGTMVGPEAWATALREIALGLRAVQ